MVVPGLQQPIAIGFEDGKAASWIPVSGYQYELLNNSPKEKKAGECYSFESVVGKVKAYRAADDSNGGGSVVQTQSSDRWFPIAAGICAGLALLFVMFYVLQKKKVY